MTDAGEGASPDRMSKDTRRALHQSFQEDLEARGCLGRAVLTALIGLGILVAAAVGAYYYFKSRGGH